MAGVEITGFDFDEQSVIQARANAVEAGSPANVSFEVAEAAEIGPGAIDVVVYFDALHDMGDPPAALRRAYEVLAPGGLVVAVEPWSLDRLEDGIGNPLVRLDYASSTALCTPTSLNQPGAYGLGNQGGSEVRLECEGFGEEVVHAGVEASLAVRRAGVCGHGQVAGAAVGPAFANPPGCPRAVKLGHTRVHEHDVVCRSDQRSRAGDSSRSRVTVRRRPSAARRLPAHDPSQSSSVRLPPTFSGFAVKAVIGNSAPLYDAALIRSNRNESFHQGFCGAIAQSVRAHP